MFQAALEDTRQIIQEQANVVTILLVIVLATSIVYYFVFFLAEVTPEFISAFINFFWRSKHEKEAEEEYDDPDVQVRSPGSYTVP